ncbi:hypothetical protein H2200_004825 [Cladophialophora chaetospira]|uniref:Uncharacterized protein n=1 Tax=Cladophialophora chaetospira TaxID=386627 RepID=A0AA39CKV8_9EURO|nr:hypothetical protein H2200_004825 [Cladophialophora chaetospira]
MSQEPSHYQFIDTSQDSNAAPTRELQRTVRSHAASVSQPDHITRRRNRIPRLNNPARGVTVFDAGLRTNFITREREALPSARINTGLTLASTHGWSFVDQRSLDPSNSLWNSLSGQTLSPISHLATYHKPYVPGIMHHYIYNLTIPIPELDGSFTEPLFRAAWLPIVVHDPLIFQIVVLFAATHYATYADPSQYNSLHLELLSLKQAALSSLIQKVQSEQGTTSSSSDTLIAAAAKMASFEAIFGVVEAFHLHMSTVARLLQTRGSLATLGMNGFLARLLSFVDINSASLLGTNLYLADTGLLPQHQPSHPPRFDQVPSQAGRPMSNPGIVNLERFIGLMSGQSIPERAASTQRRVQGSDAALE